MREIKFRVWDGEKMHYLQEIEYFDDSINFRFSHFEKTNIPLKMMLYTGLKDINGKEIYESDVVKIHSIDIMNGSLAIIIFKKQMFGLDYIDDKELLFDWIRKYHNLDSQLEVIGNIYENPELVEGEGKNEKNKG